MIDAGWSLEFIYLDQNINRFQLQKPGEDFIKEAEKNKLEREKEAQLAQESILKKNDNNNDSV